MATSKNPMKGLTAKGIASIRIGSRKPRNYEESRIQAASVARLSLLGVYVLMIPNGEITDMSERKYSRLVALGFRKGAWDTILLERGTNRFFGLEFKKPGEEQLPSQTAFEQVCIANSWPYKIAETVEEAEEAARSWGLVSGCPKTINAGGLCR